MLSFSPEIGARRCGCAGYDGPLTKKKILLRPVQYPFVYDWARYGFWLPTGQIAIGTRNSLPVVTKPALREWPSLDSIANMGVNIFVK